MSSSSPPAKETEMAKASKKSESKRPSISSTTKKDEPSLEREEEADDESDNSEGGPPSAATDDSPSWASDPLETKQLDPVVRESSKSREKKKQKEAKAKPAKEPAPGKKKKAYDVATDQDADDWADFKKGKPGNSIDQTLKDSQAKARKAERQLDRDAENDSLIEVRETHTNVSGDKRETQFTRTHLRCGRMSRCLYGCVLAFFVVLSIVAGAFAIYTYVHYEKLRSEFLVMQRVYNDCHTGLSVPANGTSSGL